MADDPRNSAEGPDPVSADSPKEDAETEATREELKHTVISDESADNVTSSAMDEDKSETVKSPGQKTPDLKPTDASDALKEQVSSPKKKRAHDEVDESQEAGASPADIGRESPQDSNGAAASSRTDRSEPEKKRARDETEEEASRATDEQNVAGVDSGESARPPEQDDGTRTSTLVTHETDTRAPAPVNEKEATAAKPDAPAISSSAFAKSGFAKLSGAASPFRALGAGSKPGGFSGASSSSPSPFGALATGAATPASAPKLTFGAAAAEKAGSSGASPFASLNGGAPKPFGSAFGSGFGGGFGTPKLTSFAKPGGALQDAKPAKPFGAPESDNEESAGDDDDDEEADSGPEEPESEEKEVEESKQGAAVEDKKKPKLQKVVVDDGEAGETTVFLARAKVYQLDKTAKAWKERGAGVLKVNVPEATVELDDHGAVVLETFDASMLEAGEQSEDAEAGSAATATRPKVVRLIMRQDHTHRVVLNTAVLAATDFVKRETLKAVTFLFTALEGPEAKPATFQIKMSPPNAEQFYKTIELIQKELKSLG